MYRWLIYNKDKTILLYIVDVLPGGHTIAGKPNLFDEAYMNKLIMQGRLKIDDNQLYRELLGGN